MASSLWNSMDSSPLEGTMAKPTDFDQNQNSSHASTPQQASFSCHPLHVNMYNLNQ
jgi:hypothetical protein